MDMGHAAQQSGLEFTSKWGSRRRGKAAPWVISLMTHAALVGGLLMLWKHSSFSPSRTWRVVSTLDLRAPTEDVIRSAASSIASSGAGKGGKTLATPAAATVVVSESASTSVPHPDALEVPYPAEARKFGAEGLVRAEWDVDGEGHAQNVKVVESSGFRVLDEAVRSSIQHHRFNAVGGHHEAKFRFVLSERGEVR